MALTDLFLAQLADPFRIGLLLALIATMLRTQAASGTWVPLAVGALFVAVIIPATQTSPVPLWQAVAVGVAVNVVILATALAAWGVFKRLRG